MMQIPCPHCGTRPENEFHCGGQSHIQRPPLDCSDEAWGQYLFGRDNPKGEHAERWRHTFGCGRWFNLLRDTVTHEIKTVYAMTDARPASSAAEVHR
jgi:sarcosine oxidase, subunit delta